MFAAQSTGLLQSMGGRVGGWMGTGVWVGVAVGGLVREYYDTPFVAHPVPIGSAVR